MRRGLLRWAGVAIVSAVCLAIGLSEGNAATTPATAVPYPACFGHATAHVQIPSHVAYECLGLGGGDLGVGVYWSDNEYELNYYWHPDSGGVVVNETFFKSCAEVTLERGGGAPCGLYDGVPVTDTAPGADSYANGRLIWLADGCLVDAPTDVASPPTSCSAVVLDGGRSVGAGRPMNAVELASVGDYWAIMDKYTPDKYW